MRDLPEGLRFTCGVATAIAVLAVGLWGIHTVVNHIEKRVEAKARARSDQLKVERGANPNSFELIDGDRSATIVARTIIVDGTRCVVVMSNTGYSSQDLTLSCQW